LEGIVLLELLLLEEFTNGNEEPCLKELPIDLASDFACSSLLKIGAPF
jgi:hypothetical protein